MELVPYLLLGLLLLVLIAVIAWRLGRPRTFVPEQARAVFEEQRVELQRLFFAAASTTGKPRGLIWTGCDFSPGLELARDRRTKELLAFVPVTISFEAVPGSDMEGLPAVGNLRSATGVFHLKHRRWTTSGRVLFNLDPADAIRHFHGQYEPLADTLPAPDPRQQR